MSCNTPSTFSTTAETFVPYLGGFMQSDFLDLMSTHVERLLKLRLHLLSTVLSLLIRSGAHSTISSITYILQKLKSSSFFAIRQDFVFPKYGDVTVSYLS